MITIAIITLLIFLVLGVPVSFAIGLSGLLAIVMGSVAAGKVVFIHFIGTCFIHYTGCVQKTHYICLNHTKHSF